MQESELVLFLKKEWEEVKLSEKYSNESYQLLVRLRDTLISLGREVEALEWALLVKEYSYNRFGSFEDSLCIAFIYYNNEDLDKSYSFFLEAFEESKGLCFESVRWEYEAFFWKTYLTLNVFHEAKLFLKYCQLRKVESLEEKKREYYFSIASILFGNTLFVEAFSFAQLAFESGGEESIKVNFLLGKLYFEVGNFYKSQEYFLRVYYLGGEKMVMKDKRYWGVISSII